MNTIDVSPININKGGKNDRGFHTLYEEEIAQLLAKNSTGIAKRPPPRTKQKQKH